MKATPETTARLRMALTEAGYPNPPVREKDGIIVYPRGSIPPEVIYRAAELVAMSNRKQISCFSCWRLGGTEVQRACIKGDCASVGESRCEQG